MRRRQENVKLGRSYSPSVSTQILFDDKHLLRRNPRIPPVAHPLSYDIPILTQLQAHFGRRLTPNVTDSHCNFWIKSLFCARLATTRRAPGHVRNKIATVPIALVSSDDEHKLPSPPQIPSFRMLILAYHQQTLIPAESTNLETCVPELSPRVPAAEISTVRDPSFSYPLHDAPKVYRELRPNIFMLCIPRKSGTCSPQGVQEPPMIDATCLNADATTSLQHPEDSSEVLPYPYKHEGHTHVHIAWFLSE